MINGKQIREDLDEKNVIEATCESLEEKPKICEEVEGMQNIDVLIYQKSRYVSPVW